MDDSSTYISNSADGTKLSGYIWRCVTPRAVMSLVHGFGEHSGRYSHMAKALNAKGIAVVSIDLRGHGRSEGKRGVVKSYADFRADIEVLMDKTRTLYPDTPHVLYGHSMGGAIVMDYGLNAADGLQDSEAPENTDIKAFISSAPLIAFAEPPPAILTPIIKFLRLINPKGAMKQPINGAKVSTLKPEQRLYMDDLLNHGQCGFGTALGMVETGKGITARAGQWTAPLLLLHSREDVLTDFTASEKFAAASQNTEFRAFDKSAHELHNDIHRAQVYALMTEFIEQYI